MGLNGGLRSSHRPGVPRVQAASTSHCQNPPATASEPLRRPSTQAVGTVCKHPARTLARSQTSPAVCLCQKPRPREGRRHPGLSQEVDPGAGAESLPPGRCSCLPAPSSPGWLPTPLSASLLSCFHLPERANFETCSSPPFISLCWPFPGAPQMWRR